jgi:FtsP/CotA-like multicopper oxidase with cupredoxin domain
MSISPVDRTFGVLAFIGALIGIAVIAIAVVLLVDPPTASVEAQQGEPGYVFDEPDVTIDLTAEVVQWDVVAGEEPVEAWVYNGQYPGPEIRITEGQSIRINLTNNLPEATTIHWHGLDVPNDQDGVPGITQPAVEPGETWTYEFTPDRVGTTVYHTHANTATQLAKGLFGFFIVEPEGGLDYDREYSLALHELSGFYTINGHSFPSTLDDSTLLINEGETILVRFANMGSVHHPMHLHGHEFMVTNIDGNPMPENWRQNTVDIPPGQTVDVVIEGDNPGTWTFHCHVVPHVTNKGVYPGGMLTLLDYEDHESYFERQSAGGE